MKITTYIFYETNSPTTYFLNAEHNDSVNRAQDWGTKGLLVGISASLESLACELEQDTLSAAKYWFDHGRPVSTWLKEC